MSNDTANPFGPRQRPNRQAGNRLLSLRTVIFSLTCISIAAFALGAGVQVDPIVADGILAALSCLLIAMIWFLFGRERK